MIRNISYKFRYIKFRYSNLIKSNTGIAIFIIGIILLIGIVMLFPHFIRNTYEVTVTNKRIVNRNNTNEYLIYTQTEGGKIRIFKNVDNFLELKFHSEDLYWAISINKKYEIKAYGFNMPLLLDYQNIIKVKSITD